MLGILEIIDWIRKVFRLFGKIIFIWVEKLPLKNLRSESLLCKILVQKLVMKYFDSKSLHWKILVRKLQSKELWLENFKLRIRASSRGKILPEYNTFVLTGKI